MYDTDEIRSMIHRSLDKKVYMRQLWGVMLAVPFGLLYSQIRYPEIRTRMLLVLASVFVPFFLIYFWRIRRLYRNLGGYIIVRATLGESKACYTKGGVSLPVYIDECIWGSVIARTNQIFHRRGITQPLLSDYENRTVTVAYNRMTDMVVVIE